MRPHPETGQGATAVTGVGSCQKQGFSYLPALQHGSPTHASAMLLDVSRVVRLNSFLS